MKCSINLLVLATVLLFSSVFCNHEYHNHHRDHYSNKYDEEFHHGYSEINTTDSIALKNNSGNFTALQQSSSFDDFKENVGLGLGAIISIPVVGIIFVCCCCYWCCRCCCGACQDDTPNVVVMNSNETHAAPPPQIIVQPVAMQPQFQQIPHAMQPQFQQMPQTQYVPQPPYAPPPGYSEFSPPSNYKY